MKWGTGFADFDQDGWLDLVHANGHVYPHLRGTSSRETYEQPALSVYVNNRDGTFRDASAEAGPGPAKRVLGRGTAFADLDNDGDLDVVVACLDGPPLVLRNDTAGGHWLQVRTVGAGATGTGSAPGSPCGGELSQLREVRRTLAIYSASDPRAHFGLGTATWPTSCGWSGRAGGWTSGGTCRRPALPRRRGGGAQARAPPPAVIATSPRPSGGRRTSRPFVNWSGTGWASAASHCAAASPTLAPATS